MSEQHCPWCNAETLSDLERRYFACYSFVADGFRRQSLRCKLTCLNEDMRHAKDLLKTVVEIHDSQVANRAVKPTVYLPDLWFAAVRNLLDKEADNDADNMPMRQDGQAGVWRSV